jgi:hypothetical protein
VVAAAGWHSIAVLALVYDAALVGDPRTSASAETLRRRKRTIVSFWHGWNDRRNSARLTLARPVKSASGGFSLGSLPVKRTAAARRMRIDDRLRRASSSVFSSR